MPAAVRSYLTTGLALIGVGFVTAAQITPPLQQAEVRVIQSAVTLAAAVGNGQACTGYNTDGCDINAPQSYVPVVLDQSGSAANIAANIVNAVASIPRAFVDAVNELSYALEVTGNWWVYSPTNVLGFDPADPPKITALADLLVPFKPVSHALGEQLSWWGKANLPMDGGCTADVGPLCKDLNSILAKMFLAPIWKLSTGYQFPTVVNPVSDAEAQLGEEIPGSVGTEVAWSGANVQLNVFDPAIGLFNYLLADPATNAPKPITRAEIAATLDRLAKALVLDFNPFVPRSFLLKGWPYTALTPLFKPFVPALCPTCDPANPGGPPIAPVPSAATTLVSASAPVDSAEAATPVAEPVAATADNGGDPVAQAGKPGRAKSADVTAPATDSVGVDSGTPAVDGNGAAEADAPSATADQPSKPLSKPRRGAHRGRTSAAAPAAADPGANSVKTRVRTAASGE